jgi:cytochrome c oxidase subunit IV
MSEIEVHDHPGARPHFHHHYPEGVIAKPNTKWIWKVFWILLVVTLIELVVGFKATDWQLNDMFLKVFFIGFTVFKAYYIVFSFMHLKDENKPMKYTVLAPFIGFIVYLVWIVLTEGIYSKEHRAKMDSQYKAPSKVEHHSGNAGEGHSEGHH